MKKNLKSVAIAIGVGTIVKSVCNLLSNNETIQKGLDSIKKERIEDKKMKEMNKRYTQQIKLDSAFNRYKKSEDRLMNEISYSKEVAKNLYFDAKEKEKMLCNKDEKMYKCKFNVCIKDYHFKEGQVYKFRYDDKRKYYVYILNNNCERYILRNKEIFDNYFELV